MDENFIKVWPFYAAPTELQTLSNNGGDEDWIAVVPAPMKDAWIGWLESNGYGHFGVCSTERIDAPDGSVVYIGSHS